MSPFVKLDFPAIRMFTSNLTHVAITTAAKAAQYTLAEFRVDKLVQEETSALISAETNVDRRAWIEECNSGDCDLLARDIL